jgi:KipI family sensor histidine kinase inhibitor
VSTAAAGTIHRLGDRALIVDVPDLESALALHSVLESERTEGIDDLVPAARTVAVLFDPVRKSADAARTWLERVLERGASAQESGSGDEPDAGPSGRPANVADAIAIDVVYDGPDLDDVAALVGVSAEQLVSRHTAATWRVAFNGFAPGFGYLVTDDDWFDVPRRSSPRTEVPAGSVGLAGAFSGAYPRRGPGGWQLIGRTDAALWRPRDSRPALLTPGAAVRFRAVDVLATEQRTDSAESTPVAASSSDVPGSAAGPAAGSVPGPVAGSAAGLVAGSAAITVLKSGPLLLVEDLGRPGGASIGAGRSGVLDRAALKLGNRLVGNDEGAAGLEVLLQAELRFEQPTWFAVTGARGALSLNGHPIEPDAAVRASAGDVLRLGSAERGVRYVVALRGGVAVARELGSASTDIGAVIGPLPLSDGDRIALGGAASREIPAVDALTVWSPPQDEVDVHVVAGPRQDWFSPASIDRFYDTGWEVTPESNRVGARLRSSAGEALERSDDHALPAELPSEPMVPGAIQVPPSGQPTVLLADAPVTGGYPVIAVVADADLDLFAQLRPGQRVRFRHARSIPG